ncbi:RNA-directed RNA polymerase [Trichinella pseudospiralis]
MDGLKDAGLRRRSEGYERWSIYIWQLSSWAKSIEKREDDWLLLFIQSVSLSAVGQFGCDSSACVLLC